MVKHKISPIVLLTIGQEVLLNDGMESKAKEPKRKRSSLEIAIREFVASKVKDGERDPFARSVGIDGGQFRRLMSGEAGWQIWHVEAVAHGLGVPPEVLINPVSDVYRIDICTVDVEALTEIIKMVEDILAASRKTTSLKKRARLIAELYENAMATGEVPSEQTVEQTVEQKLRVVPKS